MKRIAILASCLLLALSFAQAQDDTGSGVPADMPADTGAVEQQAPAPAPKKSKKTKKSKKAAAKKKHKRKKKKAQS